jgi:hypothetical protein
VDHRLFRDIQRKDKCTLGVKRREILQLGGIPRGQHHAIATLQCLLGELTAEAGRASGDEPDLVFDMTVPVGE